MKSDYTLAEFENWCLGEGRGGRQAGVHRSALDAAQRFRMFKENQKVKRLDVEYRKRAENGS